MELRNINTFLKVAELRSFSRAAKQLGYSQSAVSTQIQQLETELGCPLFDRINKTVRLTAQGEQFSLYAQTLLRTVEEARAALQTGSRVEGCLRIGMADSLCSAFLPGLLEEYHRRCPGVELRFRSCTTDEMLDLLEHNEIDLAYTLDHPLTQSNLVHALQVPEPICFIAPTNHPFADRAAISLEELMEQEWMLTEQGMSYRNALEELLAGRQLTLQPYLEMGNADLLCQLVEKGLGLSFVPEYLVRPLLTEGRLAKLRVPDCRIEVWRQLVYHKDKWLTAPMKEFIALLKEA